MNDPDVDDYYETEIPLTPELDRDFAGVGRYLIWIVVAVALLAVIAALVH